MKPFLGLALACLALSGCAGRIVPPGAGRTDRPAVRLQSHAEPYIAPARPIAPVANASGTGPSARSVGVAAGQDMASLPVTPERARRALIAFRSSCRSLTRRSDVSGLTQATDWQPPCDAAAATPEGEAVAFFRSRFEAAQVGDGVAFATGYYEPEIAASRTASADFRVPVYRRPDDLVDVDLGLFSDALKGKKIGGRVLGTRLLPYYERGEIDDGALSGKGLDIAWAADPVEFFFLQVQGSGRLRLPDGGVIRIGYAGQNGRDYVGIGALMRDRGLIVPGQLSMQGIMAWLRAHPDEGRAIMRANKSFVFFRELSGDGPVGALGVPVIGRTSVAADPAFVPLGAPVFLSMDRADVTGLWVAQDTGGAIKGTNRFDTFWGAGDEARRIAGGMSARGTAFVLLPKGTLARLGSRGEPPPAP